MPQKSREYFAEGGLANRINGLVSATLRWPKERFIVRWAHSPHCVLPYTKMFDYWGNFQVSTSKGDWVWATALVSTPYRFSYYYLQGPGTAEEVRSIYQAIYDSCLHPLDCSAFANALAVHQRDLGASHCVNWQTTARAALEMCEELQPSSIVLSADIDEFGDSMQELFESKGLPVTRPASGMTWDYDRDENSTWEFLGAWKALTACPYAVTNNLSSTIMDVSRGLGNDVRSFGRMADRKNCHLFQALGYDRRYLGPPEKHRRHGLALKM